MAAYTATRAKTITMVAAQVDSIEISNNHSKLDLVNHGAGTIYYKLDDNIALVAPTVAGDNCGVVLAGERITVNRAGGFGQSIITAISAGTPVFSVVGRR